jgi:hypothetical protein
MEEGTSSAALLAAAPPVRKLIVGSAIRAASTKTVPAFSIT